MDSSFRVAGVIKYFFKNMETPENGVSNFKIKPFGSGLIHRTFFLEHAEGHFILQKLNTHVFKNPKVLMENIKVVGEHLLAKNYPKEILKIRPTLSGDLFHQNENDDCWRMLYYIPHETLGDFEKDSPSENVFQQYIYNTGKSFGEFLFYLKDLPLEKVTASIPNFHNTRLRFEQLEKTIAADTFHRKELATTETDKIQNWKYLLADFEKLELPERIVHADPKMDNLLFNENQNVIAVIDWDTLMPGNVLHDFGDLVRTMACTLNEESTDFEQVKISPTALEHLTKGFLEATEDWLTDVEKNNLLLGAKMIIYEQSIRFLNDFIAGDTYYNTTYTGQNLNRAKNQIALLESII